MVIDILIALGAIYLFIGALHAVKHILTEDFSNLNKYGLFMKSLAIFIVAILSLVAYSLLWSIRYINISDKGAK